MGHSLGVRGQNGKLKVGYRVAAYVGPFTLTPTAPGEWSFEGSIRSSDAFWLAQDASRSLELEIGKQRWTWRDANLVVAGGAVTGTVTGRPERR